MLRHRSQLHGLVGPFDGTGFFELPCRMAAPGYMTLLTSDRSTTLRPIAAKTHFLKCAAFRPGAVSAGNSPYRSGPRRLSLKAPSPRPRSSRKRPPLHDVPGRLAWLVAHLTPWQGTRFVPRFLHASIARQLACVLVHRGASCSAGRRTRRPARIQARSSTTPVCGHSNGDA